MDVLIPVTFMAAVAAVFIVYFYFNSRNKQILHDTVKSALEKGDTLSPDLVDHLAAATPKTPENDLRRGIILLAFGLATALFGEYFIHEEEVVGMAIFPLLIGLGYGLMYWLGKRNA